MPTLAGDTATYANVVPDGDLIVRATTMGFEVFLVLRKAPSAPPVIRLPLGLEGLGLSQDGKGQLRLKDTAGADVAISPAPMMFSAARDARADEPIQTKSVATTVETDKGGPAIVLRPDYAFLSDPATVYPVTIDPAGTLTSGLSTFVASDYPTTNYDGDPLLKVGTYNGGATVDRSFIRFDDGMIKGMQVTSATLNLYETWAYSCSATQIWVDGAGVFGPGTTWNTQPWVDGRHWNADSFARGYTGCANGPGWQNLNITALVQAWQPGGPGQDALALLAPNEADSSQWKKFASINTATPPTIAVTYTIPATPSAPQYVTGTPHNGQATISWSPPAYGGQPQLNSYYVYIYTYPNYAFLTYAIACGTCTSVTVGGLNGQPYQALVAAYNGTMGTWAASNVYTEAAPPSAPLNIVATAANASGSSRWSAPASTGGVPVESYLVDVYELNGPLVSLSNVCGTCTWTTTANLTNGHSYAVALYAYNTPGGYGPAGVSNYFTPAATDPMVGAGDRSFFTQDGLALNDRTSASVNLGTGNLQVSVTDLVLPAIGGGLPLGRVYNSLAPAPGSSDWFSTAFGYDWRFNQAPDVRLVPNADGSVAYHGPSGNVATFVASGPSFVSPADLDVALVRAGDGTYTLNVSGGAEVMTFSADGNLLSTTDRNGNAMTFAYPDGRRVTSITSTAGTAPGNTAIIDYSGPAGRVASMSVTADAVTRTVRYTYDSTGIGLYQATDAAGGVTTYTFDGVSNLTQITGPAPVSQVTKFAYDSAHRVTSVTRVIPGYPDAVTRYDYTMPGHTKVTDPNADPPTDYTFAPIGAMTNAVDAKGASSSIGWTSQVKVQTSTDGMTPAATTTNVWGANGGQSLTTVTGATLASASTAYGSGVTARLRVSSTDTMGAQSTFGYDPKGNLTSVTDPMGGVMNITRNADGTVATSASPANPTNPTRYAYTNHLPTSVTPPTGNSLGSSSAGYDGSGRLRTSTSAKPMTTTFTYDALDRVKTESHSDGSATISYVYDANGNLTSRSDSTGTTSYTFDAANRPLTTTTPTAAVSYSWDPAGNLITATDPAGVTTYHYDILNRLDQVTEPGGRKDVFAYDANGRPTDSWYNTGTNVAYSGNNVIAPTNFAVHAKVTYDAAGHLVGTKTTRASSDAPANRVSDLSYAYVVPSSTACAGEPAGQPTAIRHSVTDALVGNTTAYCYDRNGRLTSANTPGGPTYAYGFDANTNRTSGPEGTHTVNSADQLSDSGFSYNSEGSLTAGGSLSTLAYNGLAQTTSITPAGGSATAYSYAGGGQTERTTAGPTTYTLGLLGVTVETTAGATTSYIRGPSGGLVAERTPTGDFYYVYDGQGSVIALVDPTGTQRAAYTYDPYGDHATATAMNGTLPVNPWRWEASYLESTGLYKLGARYYDPHLGRFTQVDPVEGGSANNYDYGAGDPINNFDVGGKAIWTCACSGHRAGPGACSEPQVILTSIGIGTSPDAAKRDCKAKLDQQAGEGCYVRHVKYKKPVRGRLPELNGADPREGLTVLIPRPTLTPTFS